MTNIAFAVIIFLEIITYFIFADVILSWLTLFGIKFRPYILVRVLEPLYSGIKKLIPTTIGPIDLTPIVILLIISFLRGLVVLNFPSVTTMLRFLNF